MISGWHMANLPVWVSGRSRPINRIDEVVVSWETRSVDGFLLLPRWCLPVFVPTGKDVGVTEMGITLQSPSLIKRCDRGFRRQTVQDAQSWKGRPVVSQRGRFCGHLKDVIFDGDSTEIRYLVISRGVIGDLMVGAYVASIKQLTEFGAQAVKIFVPGES